MMTRGSGIVINTRKGTRKFKPSFRPWLLLACLLFIIQIGIVYYGLKIQSGLDGTTRGSSALSGLLVGQNPLQNYREDVGLMSVMEVRSAAGMIEPSQSVHTINFLDLQKTLRKDRSRDDLDTTILKNSILNEMASRIRSKFKPGTMVKPCKRYQQEQGSDLRRTIDDRCRSGLDKDLVLYNHLEYKRYIRCENGKFVIIKPDTVLRPDDIKKSCGGFQEVLLPLTRLFIAEPSLGNPSLMPKVKLYRTSRSTTDDFPCDVPCEMEPGDPGIMPTWSVGDTDWTFIFSMENSIYYSTLEVDPSSHRVNHFYATTSFKAEIPLPYFSWMEYKIQQPAVDYDKVIKGASFIASNCGSTNDREGVVSELTKIMRVDSLGSCLYNAEPPNGVDIDDKKGLQQQYLFHLAFENSQEVDYVTEKLWGTLQSGTLAVYFGAPNIHEHAPPNSIISWHDFPNTTALGEYLLRVAANKTLYESYHEWRKKPLPESFHRKFDFTHTHSICRMCRWSFAKMYGLGWNHTAQKIQETVVSRNICFATNGLVAGPFQEVWKRSGKEILPNDKSDDTCARSLKTTLALAEGLSRTLWSHDGVVDMFLDNNNNQDLELRLVTPIRGRFYERTKEHFQLQDEQSRLTLLTNWDASVLGDSEPGVLNIRIPKHDDANGRIMIRIIMEDLDTFHEGGKNEINHFGGLMTKDFETPLEAFLVSSPPS